jgi:dihydroorotase
VRIFTDDGTGVQDAALMRRALEYASDLGAVVADHCEEASLAGQGCMNEGDLSRLLGLPGRPAVSEEVMVLRDLALARLTGARLHLLHLSTAASVAAVRQAKAAGATVTAEVTPHHLALTEQALGTYDTVFKVNPPLRAASDVAALRQGLRDGTIDAVATDHAPHAPAAKQLAFRDAAPGMIGLETALAVVLGALAVSGEPGMPIGEPGMTIGEAGMTIGDAGMTSGEAGMTIGRVLALMSWQPARIAGLSGVHGGPLVPGAPANLCVIDLARTWQVEPGALASRSRNTPFAGLTLMGKVRHTLLAGEPVVIGGEAQR